MNKTIASLLAAAALALGALREWRRRRHRR